MKQAFLILLSAGILFRSPFLRDFSPNRRCLRLQKASEHAQLDKSRNLIYSSRINPSGRSNSTSERFPSSDPDSEDESGDSEFEVESIRDRQVIERRCNIWSNGVAMNPMITRGSLRHTSLIVRRWMPS